MNVYRAAIAALIDEYCVRRGHCLTVIPRANPDFYQHECDVLTECGFSIRRKNPDPNRYLVDLSLDEDTLMRSLDQKWRYNLRQALANNFDIRFCESDDDIQTFQSLYAAMVARKNFSSTPPDHLIGRRNASFAPELRPRLVLAFHEGQPVVGATVSIFGDTAYYTFGASSAASLSLRGGYALQWWIAQWLREQGVRWYDLGGEAGEHGLRQFKKGFVGKRGAVVEMYGEYDRWTHVSGRIATDVIYGLRAAQRTIRQWRYGG
jgi:lipid II:glycine glycyltransferase (peptidoglycan interpeptide bridge formation enzyme)